MGQRRLPDQIIDNLAGDAAARKCRQHMDSSQLAAGPIDGHDPALSGDFPIQGGDDVQFTCMGKPEADGGVTGIDGAEVSGGGDVD